ncbi:MAG: molybdopterin-dependent oxidoreductase [Psychrilyobacter sp.]|nr:molybdopterin-dependent oxidoreductase [Psychrilyobacter sp.]
MGYIGEKINKIDGMGLIKGASAYTEDISLGHDTLIVKLLRSPHAFAKIRSIDTTIAKKINGIECILTYLDDEVTSKRFTLAGQSFPEPSPHDRRILGEYVRYVGDEVAIIAGKDEETVLKAMKLIKVEYDILEPILDFEKAIDNKTIIHSEKPYTCFDYGNEHLRNIAAKDLLVEGDVEEEFKKSEVIIEHTYHTQSQIHGMMENYIAVTYMDFQNRMNIVSSTQVPFHVRRQISKILDIPRSKIKVIKPRVGGGFGGKQTSPMEIYPALVTKVTGKPAKLAYTRKETHSCTTTRHEMKLTVKLGASKDGIINAVDIHGLSNTGAYGEHAWTVFTVVGQKTLPMYRAKARRFYGEVVYTNKTTAGAFRGYGATQGTFALESAINELAKKLDIDPSVLRDKNLVKEGEINPTLNSFVGNDAARLESSTLDQCIARGKEMIGWDEKYPMKKISPTIARGVGMAVTMQGSGIHGIDTASATLKLNDDGFYTLLVGVSDMGQGCDTIVAQMAAEVLGVPISKIIVNSSDTDVNPYDPGAYASSGTYVTGNAVIKAANLMIEKILEGASKILNISIEDIEFNGETLLLKDGSEITLDELAYRLVSYEGQNQITTTGTWGGFTSPPPFVAGFAEVEVDLETGKSTMIDFVAVVDCGTVINPNLAKIQVEGGIAQGIGLALFEEIHYDKNGKLLSDTFMQYKIPSRCDLGDIRVEFKPSYEQTGPFGAKSIGEVVINTGAPAVAHAITNATGINFRTLPITPERVLMGIIGKNK